MNLLYIFGNFPIFFALLALSGYVSIISHAPYYQLFAPVKSAVYSACDPATSSLLAVFGIQSEITVATGWTYLMYALSLITVFTFGPVNVGATYILRSMFRGEPVFFFSDFWHAVKKNAKQGIIFGIIDAIMLVMLSYDIVYFNVRMSESMILSMMFFMSILMAVMYFFMRLYIYLMMITFDLSFGKLIKNAAFFALLGIKRNVMALLGVIFMAAVDFAIMSFFPPLAVILPFIIMIGIGSYLGVYCAYPKIKEYMIDSSSDAGEEEQA